MYKNKEKFSLKPTIKSAVKSEPKIYEKKGRGASLVIVFRDWYTACKAYRNLEINVTDVDF